MASYLAFIKAVLPRYVAIALLLSLVLMLASGWVIAARVPAMDLAATIWESIPKPGPRRDPYERDWYTFEVGGLFYTSTGVANRRFDNANVQMRVPPDDYPIEMLAEVAFGFPFRSHYCYLGRRIQSGGVFVIGGTVLTPQDNRIIPTVVGIGLLANTLALFPVALLVLVAIRSGIFLSRRSRGLCPFCAYILQSAGDAARRCPECGKSAGIASGGGLPTK